VAPTTTTTTTVAPTTTTTTTIAAPCYVYPEIAYGSTAEIACTNANTFDYILVAGDTELFQNATVIGRRCPLTQTASNVGWYSNGSISRYWDGNSFIQQFPCEQ
jgi:hypothetical protein